MKRQGVYKKPPLYVLIVVFILLAGTIVNTAYIYYKKHESQYRAEVESRLSAIADLKVNELVQWRKERLEDAAFFHRNVIIADLVQRFLERPKDVEAQQQLRMWLSQMQTVHQYNSVMLLDAGYFKRIILPDIPERGTSHVSPATSEVLKSGHVVIEDFYWNEESRRVYLKVLIPVFERGSGPRMLGVLAFRIDPETYLYPFIRKWPVPSHSAETLLIRREGNEIVYLNRLRFYDKAPLTLRIPLDKRDTPTVMAALGKEGVVEGKDYRGVPVVAAIRAVPGSPWFLAARMDTSEVYAPLREKLLIVVVLIGALLIAIGAAALFMWRRRATLFYREQFEAGERLRAEEEKYGALYDNVGVGVAMISPHMEVLALNRKMEEWFPHIDLGQHPLCHRAFRFPPQDESCPDCPVSLTFRDGTPHEAEMEIRTPKGGTRHLRITSTPLTDTDGRVTAIIEMVDDITDRKLAADALEESESILKSITLSARDAIVMVNPEGKVTFWNPAAETIFGYTHSETMGKDLHDLIAPQRYHAAHHAALPEFLSTGRGGAVGKTIELQALRKEGTEITVALSLSAIEIKGGWYAVGILRDITEQKEAEEALHRSMEELALANKQLENAIEQANGMAVQAQAANIAKSQFLANMSHEIRTPMNGIIGMTGLLMDTQLSGEQRRCAETIRSSGDALLYVINDILDFSKIEADRLELEELDFDLRAMLEDTAELLAFRAHEKQLEFICHIDPEVPTFLQGDPGRLRQILVNLGGNAIKFTTKGEVSIFVTLASETNNHIKARFEVQDTGIGIPGDKIGTLFQAFQQVDASTTRRFGGTGLGLAISRRLAELMGGEIGVESIDGQGSTFWFTAILGKQPPREFGEGPPRADVRDVRILAVDDNATNRLVLAEQLASWGVRHREVESAAQAMEVLRAARAEGDPFRIVVTDMQMPEMDGESFGRLLKADPGLRDTILVMMTSLGRRGDAKDLDAIGFSAYLTKPVKQSQLYDCLATVLAGPSQAKAAEAVLITRHTLNEARRQKIRILLAEDNATNQQVALRILEKLGFRAEAVANGEEAIRALETAPYDLVFMDVQMPVMDGFEATRSIRSGSTRVPNPHIPIIAMTAHAMKGDRERCLQEGMDDYIAKPISPQALSQAIEKWLGHEEEHTVVAALPLRATGSPGEVPVFDRQALLTRLMNDEDLAQEIMIGFLEDIPKQMAILRNYIDEGNTGSAGTQAHTIKGAAANVGAMALSAVAFRMETAGRNGRLEETASLMPQLERQFQLLYAKMEEVQ